MSGERENVEIVRSLLGPFEGLNVAEIDWTADAIREVLEAACSPDVEVRTLESGTGTGVDPIYRGIAGLVRYLQDWLEPFGEYRTDWLDFVGAGDFVLVPTSQWGTGAGSGARVELDLAYACEVKDLRITRILQYETLDDARSAIETPG